MTNESDAEVKGAYAGLYAAKKLQERWDYRFNEQKFKTEQKTKIQSVQID